VRNLLCPKLVKLDFWLRCCEEIPPSLQQNLQEIDQKNLGDFFN
jgi:hypothetical protein